MEAFIVKVFAELSIAAAENQDFDVWGDEERLQVYFQRVEVF